MKSELLKAFNALVNKKFGGGGAGQGNSGNTGNKGSAGSGNAGGAEIEVDDNSFTDRVFNGSKPAIVFFYAPWCGHCKSLKPEFTKAARKLGAKVDFIKYDADANKGQAAAFDIRGYPTLQWFDRNTGTRTRKDGVV